MPRRGHVRNWWRRPFFCAGCQRVHGKTVDRWESLDGRFYCGRQFCKALASQQQAQPTPTLPDSRRAEPLSASARPSFVEETHAPYRCAP